MNKLIEQLKDAEQDFEFYPTTKEMIRTIFEHRRHPWIDGSGYRVDSQPGGHRPGVRAGHGSWCRKVF